MSLRQVDSRDPNLAIPLERLENENEARTGVPVKPRQPFAKAAPIDSCRPLSAARPSREATAETVSPIRISFPSRNGSTGTDTARDGTAGGTLTTIGRAGGADT